LPAANNWPAKKGQLALEACPRPCTEWARKVLRRKSDLRWKPTMKNAMATTKTWLEAIRAFAADQVKLERALTQRLRSVA